MMCQRCGVRPGTMNWGGTHDSVSLARNQSLIQRWCMRCALEEQLRHARAMADRISGLERRLAELPE